MNTVLPWPAGGKIAPKNHLATLREMARWRGFSNSVFQGSGGRYACPPRTSADARLSSLGAVCGHAVAPLAQHGSSVEPNQNRDHPQASNNIHHEIHLVPTFTPIPMKPPFYQVRLATAMQQLDLAPGTVATVSVQHDLGCPMLAGRPVCRCTPDIYIQAGQDHLRVRNDSSVRPLTAQSEKPKTTTAK